MYYMDTMLFNKTEILENLARGLLKTKEMIVVLFYKWFKISFDEN